MEKPGPSLEEAWALSTEEVGCVARCQSAQPQCPNEVAQGLGHLLPSRSCLTHGCPLPLVLCPALPTAHF